MTSGDGGINSLHHFCVKVIGGRKLTDTPQIWCIHLWTAPKSQSKPNLIAIGCGSGSRAKFSKYAFSLPVVRYIASSAWSCHCQIGVEVLGLSPPLSCHLRPLAAGETHTYKVNTALKKKLSGLNFLSDAYFATLKVRLWGSCKQMFLFCIQSTQFLFGNIYTKAFARHT